MWSIIDEPVKNDYFMKATGDEKQKRIDEITSFVRYCLTYVRNLDLANALTVGYEFSSQLDVVADMEDVVSSHDYKPLRSEIEASHGPAPERADRILARAAA